ncbi:DUF4831 family protein [Labilibacter sediminis]|nr:DUF4831 family protein [Labilibacter sediminis]
MHKIHLARKTLFTLILIALSINIFAKKKPPVKVEVKKTSEVIDPTSQSITYMLPQTVIQVEIETEKIIKKAGPYYRYSQRSLNLTDVITEDSEEWIIKGVKITTKSEPNQSQRYSIFSTGKTSANWISLNEQGILTGINNSIVNQSNPAVTNNIGSTADDNISFDDIALPEELLLKTSTAAMAQEAANMIYKIRTNRVELLSGELENLPPDGEAYKTVLNQLDKMEKDFISLFAGKTISTSTKQTFEILPDPLSSYSNFVLCRFSKQKGIVAPMDITGTPVYLRINNLPFTELENKQTEAPKEPVSNGLYYYLPGSVIVSVLDKTTELQSTKLQLAQYGQVISMPPSILEQENVVIEICPVTGALLNISTN